MKSTADQYRMIPTERVWKGINNALHTRRKWYGLGLTLLLLLTAVSVTWVMLSYPASKKQESTSDQSSRNVARVQPDNQLQLATIAAPKDMGTILAFNRFSPGRNEAPVTTNSQMNEFPAFVEIDPVSLAITDSKASEQVTDLKSYDGTILHKRLLTDPAIDIFTMSDPLEISVVQDKTPDYLPIRPERRTVKSNTNYYPLTIESLFNSYQAKKIVRKLSWQFYFAPTVSYRRLSVNKSYDANVSPFSASNYPFANSRDVNGQVTHKPDMGLEVGLSTKYPLSKNLKLTGAFQFNINRYDIKAFAYYGEEATINLNGGNGTNSVRAWTYYRNYDGYK